jgi:hypothetical protein
MIFSKVRLGSFATGWSQPLSRRIGYAPESGSKIRASATHRPGPLRVDDAVVGVHQARIDPHWLRADQSTP